MQSRSAEERRAELVDLFHEASGCVRCPLSQGRTKVVFGNGNANADLMFVGEGPGHHEDLQGLPFVGRAGKLLDQLLGDIGLSRQEVFVANVIKCLRYNAMVQLGDGSWERIGLLVRSRYSGTVMSLGADGRLIPRQVTGWHATPLAGRPVFRLTYASAKNAGASKVAIDLTGDHPVLTERGWVRVDSLEAGDRIATGQGLSEVAFDVVCGTVLGDGHLNRASAHLSFSHSDRQAVYAQYKADLLSELRTNYAELQVAAVSGGPADYPVVHVRTRAHRALGTLRRDFYGDRGKHVPPWIEERLNARMLAFWFMDDGYLRNRSGRSPSAEIAAHGFSEHDLRILVRALARLGLPATPARGRLFFDVATTRALSERIAPFVPWSMRYKLHPDVARSVPLDPERLRPGPPVVLYDDVEVQDITDRMGNDKTFFCIDVEETHNFVTAGGVVHNCRPPGNRDPLPEEIEACKPYLHRQIELIEPKVICTLGNFATKLLTRSQRGITGVHGRPQVHELGGRTVRLFPIYHPAAALRSTRTLEELREDFAKLPALLEEPPPVPIGVVAPVAAAVAAAGPEPEPPQMDLFG
jgi:uracil-DNA glycosylase family 4